MKLHIMVKEFDLYETISGITGFPYSKPWESHFEVADSMVVCRTLEVVRTVHGFIG